MERDSRETERGWHPSRREKVLLVESLGICSERENHVREYDDLVVALLVVSHQELTRWAWFKSRDRINRVMR